MKELNFHEHKEGFQDERLEREWQEAANHKCMTEAEILKLSEEERLKRECKK